MDNKSLEININISDKIYTIRGKQVMLDRDLAELYGVKTKRLNEQVRRNIERFPKNYRFKLSNEELRNLRSQFATSSFKEHGGSRYLPYAFTEQGVAMLSSVLNSKVAIKTSIKIIDTFIKMRKFINQNASIFQRLDNVEQKQLVTETKLDNVLDIIEQKDFKSKQGIFFDGEIFDAYVFISDLIKSAKSSIILIGNYIDETVLNLFSKAKPNIKIIIYTKSITDALKLDLTKYNKQYPKIEIKKFTKSHDRFLIIDNKIG